MKSNDEILKEWITKELDLAWSKMGSTGAYDYKINMENFWFGYFRALEDIATLMGWEEHIFKDGKK